MQVDHGTGFVRGTTGTVHKSTNGLAPWCARAKGGLALVTICAEPGEHDRLCKKCFPTKHKPDYGIEVNGVIVATVTKKEIA